MWFGCSSPVCLRSKFNMATNFSFNFEIPESNSNIVAKEHQSEQKQAEKLRKASAQFVYPNPKHLENLFLSGYEAKSVGIEDAENFQKGNSCRLLYLSETYVENVIKICEEYSGSATNQALKSNTDLIPSSYEGGLKIWECSIDLVNYLHKLSLEKKVDFKDKNVLELGCGAGLPGIYAFLNGANVHFQDYNAEVLNIFTIPNVVLNANSGNSSVDVSEMFLQNIQTCKFISGDWVSASLLLEPMSFDFILTSETIYNVHAQKSLYELIKFALKPSGIAFVAAKNFYFGVGGGIDQFSNLVKSDSVFGISKVTTCGYGIKREILVMENR